MTYWYADLLKWAFQNTKLGCVFISIFMKVKYLSLNRYSLHKQDIIKFLKQHALDIDQELLLNCNGQKILMNVRLEKKHKKRRARGR